MATNKVLEFEKIPIDNENFFITNIPKDIVDTLAELMFSSIQKYFNKESQ